MDIKAGNIKEMFNVSQAYYNELSTVFAILNPINM